MITCPYNPSHLIESNRIPFHLTKCKNNANVTLSVCPFNATHQMPKESLDDHIKQCKDRTLFDSYKYALNEPEKQVGHSIEHPDFNATEESWDVESNLNTYTLKNEPKDGILVLPRGMTPAERRQFRQDQRQQYNTDKKK